MIILFKLILNVIIILFCITKCNSQDKFLAGSYALGGNVGWSKTNSGIEPSIQNIWNTKSWNLFVEPNISYFILKNISSDFYIGYGYGKSDEKYSDLYFSYRRNQYSTNGYVGLGLGFYIPLNHIYPFIKTQFFYKYSLIRTEELFETDYSSGEIIKNRFKEDNQSLRTSIGIAFFLSKSVALEPAFSYEYGWYSNSTKETYTYFINLGIKYYVFEFLLF